MPKIRTHAVVKEVYNEYQAQDMIHQFKGTLL